MHPQFKKGIYGSLLVYSIILVIAYILYLKFPRQSHAPALYFLVLIGLFYIAVTWCVFSSLLALFKVKRQLQFGFLIINGIYILLCISFVLFFSH